MNIQERIARAKREIQEDISVGNIPTTITCFSDLHEYVDANGYGGFFEAEVWEGRDTEEVCLIAGEVHRVVSGWIRGGFLGE